MNTRVIINPETITKSDICYDFLVKEWILERNISVVKIKYAEEFRNYSLDKNVVEFKGMYFLKLDKTFSEIHPRLAQLQRDMLLPFVKEQCVRDYIDLSYSINSFRSDDEIYVCCFSHGNICNAIAILSLSFYEPDIFHQSIVGISSSSLIPRINVLCSFSFLNPNSNAKDSSHIQPIAKVKVRFGQILMYYALRSLKEREYPYCQLECHANLLPYYMTKLRFRLGSCPEFDITKYLCRRTFTPVFEHEYLERAFRMGQHISEQIIQKHPEFAHLSDIEKMKQVARIDHTTFFPVDVFEKEFSTSVLFDCYFKLNPSNLKGLLDLIVQEFNDEFIEARMFFMNEDYPVFINNLLAVNHIVEAEEDNDQKYLQVLDTTANN